MIGNSELKIRGSFINKFNWASKAGRISPERDEGRRYTRKSKS